MPQHVRTSETHPAQTGKRSCRRTQVQVWKYDDEEYETLIRPVSGDWSREETDYLIELAERLDLRFVVMADRYEVRAPARLQRALG